MKALVDKSKLDVVKVFLHFVASVGDVEKTALACDLDPALVRQLADSEGWGDKVRRLSLASKGSGLQAGEFERMQNRALAWVQGHRMRQVIDKVVCHLHGMDTEELVSEIKAVDRDGNTRISARFFSDMAKALETVNGLCFAALGDTVPERKAATPDAAASTAAVHAALIAALNGPGVKSIPSETLVADVTKAIGPVCQAVTLEAEVVPSVERKCLPALTEVGECVGVKESDTPPSEV